MCSGARGVPVGREAHPVPPRPGPPTSDALGQELLLRLPPHRSDCCTPLHLHQAQAHTASCSAPMWLRRYLEVLLQGRVQQVGPFLISQRIQVEGRAFRSCSDLRSWTASSGFSWTVVCTLPCHETRGLLGEFQEARGFRPSRPSS